MKKILILIVVICFFGVGLSSAFMEDKLYCTITSHEITVTLDKQSNYKCQEYIVVLRQAINKEYNNVLAIQKLIEQNYDIDFWKNIREQKRSQIQKMISIKQQIENSVLDFEENLFEKTKEYIEYSISPYRIRYKRLLKPLENLSEEVYLSSSTRQKIKLMQEQLDVIAQIMLVEDYDTLMRYFNKYIYLKKQIEWK